MAVLQLNVNLLFSAIRHACFHLIDHREALNAINVFPVADGDTGNNMAATAEAIINYSECKSSLNDTIRSIANAAILGARGNSGMIFSQFFNGWLEITLDEALDPKQFAALIAASCKSVRNAIVNPVEGTMLTVMETFSSNLSKHQEQAENFISLFKPALLALDDALQNTTNTLAVLKEARVVDAGALGFSIFMRHFASYIENPQPDKHKQLQLEDHFFDHHEMPLNGAPPTHRYCTEALILGAAINKEALSELLQHHGDSIVLTANPHLCRLHLHCDKPWEVFGELEKIGQIKHSKIDDMQRQFEMLHAPKHKIALVTDSSANIPQAFLDAHQIHMIPLNVQIGEHAFLDKWGLNNEIFYEKLANLKQYPTTSSPTTALIEEKIKYLSEHYEAVMVISVAQALSSTYNSLFNAAKGFSNVYVFNSCHVSGSQGLLVQYAADLITEGKDVNTLLEKLQIAVSNTHFFVMVNQFDSLIRSGRIGKLKGRFAELTGMRPIISLDNEGKVILVDRAFNETKAIAKLTQEAVRLTQKAPLHSYCIIHAGAPEKAAAFAEKATEALGQAPLFIESVSTAIGLHAGKGCVAIACMLKERT